jgi:MFS family permease
MAWGLFLVLAPFGMKDIGIVAAIYPAVWGGRLLPERCPAILQKSMLFWGMLLQGVALVLLVFASALIHYLVLAALLGWGTAMVYPTFLATIAENTHPHDRAQSLGVFRFWRDLGYAVGALLTGIIADMLGVHAGILVIGALTLGSALIIQHRMRCRTNAIKLATWFLRKLQHVLGFHGLQTEQKQTRESYFRVRS